MNALDTRRQYPWAVNPLRPFHELLRFAVEHARQLHPKPVEPLDREQLLNLYFLVCACHQILIDYLHTRGLARLAGLLEKHRTRRGTPHAPGTGQSAGIRLIGHMHLLLFGRLWKAEAELAGLCSALAGALHGICRDGTPVPTDVWGVFVALIENLARRGYPAALRSTCPAIPTAFRDEPLTMEDCFALSKRALEGPIRAGGYRNVLLIGVRTSGGYMAPLCAAALERGGVSSVSWLTLRPTRGSFSSGFLPSERAVVERFARLPAHLVLVVDDAPYSGSTLKRAHAILRDAGVAGSALFLLVPRFDDAPFWQDEAVKETSAEPRDAGAIRAITVRRSSLHLLKTINARWVAGRLADCPTCESTVAVTEVGISPRRRELDGLPYRPARPFPRFTRIFEVTKKGHARIETRRVAAVCVGQGFWGYGVAFLAEGLSPLVPRLLALQQGVALLDWPQEVRPPARQGPGRGAFLEHLGRYIAARAAVSLQCGREEGLQLERRGAGFGLLRQLFSAGLGPLSRPYSLWLRRRVPLSHLLGQGPRCIIDGDLTARGWAHGPDGGFVRLTFDEAAFDWRDLRIFDPLFDLACAAFELDLTAEETEAVLRRYCASVYDDRHLRERLVLYRLLHAHSLARDLLTALGGSYTLRALPPRTPGERISQERLLERCEHDLTETLTGHLGNTLRQVSGPTAPVGVFAIDIDGVLETERLGFTATSSAAVEALALLKQAGYLVTLNTGRSLAEARLRCRHLGIPLAIAEHGAVLWDAAKEHTTVLVGREDRAERRRLLRDTRTDKSIIHASGFVCGLRMFRRGKRGIAPIPVQEIDARFERLGISRLRYVTTSGTTDVCFRAADKGTALRALVTGLGLAALPVYSIGDSLPDLPMFQASTAAYAPANAFSGLREQLAGEPRVQLAPYAGQVGLLWAVKDVLRKHGDRARAGRAGTKADALEQMASRHEAIQRLWPLLARLRTS